MNQETKLDLSVLDKITIPEVESIESFEEKVEKESKDELEEAALQEVESIDTFDPNEEVEMEDASASENSESNEGGEEDSLREIAKWAHDLGIFDYDEKDFQSSEDYFRDKFFVKVKQEAFNALPDRKSTRLNSSHIPLSRMPSSA